MNKRTIVGTLAVFMFLLIAAQTVTAQQYSAKDYLKAGDNYFKQGDYVKAIEYYEYILDRYPTSKEANDAKKKLAQAQAKAKITTPLTEANFEFVQNSTGGITITGYKNEKRGIRDLVIPAQILGINVTAIAEGAFANGKFSDRGRYEKLDKPEVFESVTIPSTVGDIGDSAFCERGIKKLTLPEGRCSIGMGAFAENQLTSVTLPPSFTGISGFAFANNQLTSIDIPSGATFIGQGAFGGNKLTKVTIPASVTTIAAGAFRDNQLTELTIPAGVTTIGQYAFADNMISKLTFPNSGGQLLVGGYAFRNNRLKSLVLPEGFTISTGEGEVFGDNPLGYIKIPSRIHRETSQYSNVRSNTSPLTSLAVPAVEWLQPSGNIVPIEKADMFKIGDNINTRNMGFEQGFINYYTSQGSKAGIYMRKGPIWVTATQEEFDAFIAEKTK